MADETYLVTGAMGCIGAWALRHLTGRGARVIAADLSEDRARPRLVMDEAALGAVTWLRLDITDTAAVDRAVAENGATRIIHLAGLQIPFCRANPPLGAAVNVVGTVNVFEAARHHGVRGLAYASSLAALGHAQNYDTWPLPDDARTLPTNLYGVYKVANEETARIYAQDWGVGSIGLRPYTVYGVARDQGVTADVAKAILAAAAGRPFHIRFGGSNAVQHASDVARIFIACADAGAEGAHVFNLRNDVVEIGEIVRLIGEIVPGAAITFQADAPLPFPADLSDAGLRGMIGEVPHTPLRQAIARDVQMYRDLIGRGLIDLGQLER